MKYQYNYGFLAKWLENNKKNLPKGAIQEAVGSKSNNAFKSWVRMDGPMPVITMVRFCNAFQIPISSFFRDADAQDGAVPSRPEPDDQLEPNGGYADLESRTQGERTVLDPLDVPMINTVIPGSSLSVAEVTEDDAHADTNKIVVGNITDANMAALIKLQRDHAANERELMEQKNRLLDIIAEQQKQIADLTNLLFKLRQQPMDAGYTCSMVSEQTTDR